MKLSHVRLQRSFLFEKIYETNIHVSEQNMFSLCKISVENGKEFGLFGNHLLDNGGRESSLCYSPILTLTFILPKITPFASFRQILLSLVPSETSAPKKWTGRPWCASCGGPGKGSPGPPQLAHNGLASLWISIHDYACLDLRGAR
jgi:hypothetical protein